MQNKDMPKYVIGDKVLNVNYLTYIGNARKFLKINMEPIQTVIAADVCTPWIDRRNAPCFSVVFKDIKSAIQDPCNKSYIFYQDSGLDVDRGDNQLLCFRSDYDEIQKIIDKDVQSKADKSRDKMNKAILRLEHQISQEREDHNKYAALCNEHAYALLAQLEVESDE